MHHGGHICFWNISCSSTFLNIALLYVILYYMHIDTHLQPTSISIFTLCLIEHAASKIINSGLFLFLNKLMFKHCTTWIYMNSETWMIVLVFSLLSSLKNHNIHRVYIFGNNLPSEWHTNIYLNQTKAHSNQTEVIK